MGGVREFYEKIGNVGEDLVADILQPLGPVERSHNGADLVWRSVEIEVKTARPHSSAGRARYQFCMRKDHHTDVRHADVAILVCMPNYPKPAGASFFVIPAERIASKQIYLRGDLVRARGQWAEYLDRWDLLEEIAQRKEA